jgi:hypothetical protein
MRNAAEYRAVLQSPDMGTRPRCGCADRVRVWGVRANLMPPDRGVLFRACKRLGAEVSAGWRPNPKRCRAPHSKGRDACPPFGVRRFPPLWIGSRPAGLRDKRGQVPPFHIRGRRSTVQGHSSRTRPRPSRGLSGSRRDLPCAALPRLRTSVHRTRQRRTDADAVHRRRRVWAVVDIEFGQQRPSRRR